VGSSYSSKGSKSRYLLYDWNRKIRFLQSARDRRACRKDGIDLKLRQFNPQRGESIYFSFRPTFIDDYVFSLDVTKIVQPLAKRIDTIFIRGQRTASQNSDARGVLRMSVQAKRQ